MNTTAIRVFGARFMLATLLASFAAFSQEPPAADAAAAPVDSDPAVGTASAEADALESLEPGVDTSADANAFESLEPGAPSAVLASDVSRTRASGGVMDRLTLEATEIVGNQELPKVLYIVPWQEAAPGDLMGKPVNTLLDEVLAPIDREEFVRQVDYYGDLYGEGE